MHEALPDPAVIEQQLAVVNNLSDEEIDRLYNAAEAIEKDKQRNPFYYFKPFPKQQKFMEFNTKIKGLLGGNQSGKTSAGAFYVIKKCLAKPNSHWWAGSMTMEMSRLGVQRKIFDMIPWDDIDADNEYSSDKGWKNNTIKFKNGSDISFKSYDQRRRTWGSVTIDGVWLDEEPPWDIYQECQPRVMAKDGEIIFTMTAHNGYTRFVNHIFMQSNDDVKVVMISTYDNTVDSGGGLTREQVAKMEHDIDPADRRARIEGIPTEKAGLVFSMEQTTKEPVFVPFAHEGRINPAWPVLVSIDPHPNTPHAVVWMAIGPDEHVWVFKEKPWLMEKDSMQKADWMNPIDFAKYIHRANTGLRIEGILIDKFSGNSRSIDSGSTFRELLMDQNLYTMDVGGDVEEKIILARQYMQSGKLHIYESCWNLHWELRRYIWESWMSETMADKAEDKQKPRGKNDHLIDCVMNGLQYISRNKGLEFDIPSQQMNPLRKDVVDNKDLYFEDNYHDVGQSQESLIGAYE